MPKLPKNYSNGLIYKLCCKDTSIKEIYVGSTTNFTQRKRNHKSSCNIDTNKGYNFKVYQFIRANGGWCNWDMVLIEYYPCNTELELCRKEDYWKQELQASLNSKTPHIYENVKEQSKEYRQANRDQIVKKEKEWREAHKDTTKEYMKAYYQANKETAKEKAKEWREANQERIAEHHKEYQQSHREEIAEYQKDYYESNKEELLGKMKQKSLANVVVRLVE